MAKLDQIEIGGTIHELVPEIAPLFSASTAYAAGACVIKDAVLYRFKTAHAAGAWVGTDAEAITVGNELTGLKQDFNQTSQNNNLYDGVIVDGYWNNKNMVDATKYSPFQSIKINYLPKGNYKISFENEIRVIRKVICDQIFTVGYNVEAKKPFYFNVPFNNAPLGFSFAGRSSGASVKYDGYILIEQDGDTLSAEKYTSQDVIAEKDIAYLKGITSILDGVQVSKTDDFVLGAIGSSSVTVRNDRVCTITYYPVQKGDMVFFKTPSAAADLGIGFAVARYSEPKYSGYINTRSWYRNDNGNNQQLRAPYIVTNENYIRFTLSAADNPDLSAIAFDDAFYILRPSSNSLQMFNLLYGEAEPISGKKPVKYTGQGSLAIGQDGTFINGDLWCFYDGVTSGQIKVLDIDTDTITATKTHNLGHANTADYNPNNKTLACFYTESHKPHILLYKDPAEAETLLKTDADCMIIPLYDGTTQMSSSGGLCWGENDNVIYFMDGVYSHYDGETGVVADEINITKILLGRGDNDLSENGYGTFISGKTEDEYNGTCTILKQYKGSMNDVLAWAVISGGSPVFLGLQTIQGMEYDGYLYIGWGTNGHNYFKIQLDENRETYSIVYTYKYLYTDYKNAPYYREPELVALTPDRIFCGDASGNLLAFSR